MTAEELEEVGGVLVDDDVCVGDVDSELVREEVFSILSWGLDNGRIRYCQRKEYS